MARTLPWVSSPGRNSVTKQNPSRAKRPQLAQEHKRLPFPFTQIDEAGDLDKSDSEDESRRSHKPRREPMGKQNNRETRPLRSPSTSPPPAPPPVSPMRSGYNADDAYIMVEDEFYLVAQQFTAGLHHREYKRLKLKAQEESVARKKQGSKGVSTNTDRRLTDTNLGVKEEESEQERRAGVKGSKRRGIKSEDDIDAEERNQEDNDNWAGTVLGRLMKSGQQKTSLLGLDGFGDNSTRAAQGYGNVRDARNRTTTTSRYSPPTSNQIPSQVRATPGLAQAATKSLRDKDDIADVAKKIDKDYKRLDSATDISTQTARRNAGAVSKITPRLTAREDRSQPKRRWIDMLDDFDDDAVPDSLPPPSAVKKQGSEPSRVRQKKAA